MTTITISAGAVFFFGAVVGFVAGMIALAVIAAKVNYKKR